MTALDLLSGRFYAVCRHAALRSCSLGAVSFFAVTSRLPGREAPVHRMRPRLCRRPRGRVFFCAAPRAIPCTRSCSSVASEALFRAQTPQCRKAGSADKRFLGVFLLFCQRVQKLACSEISLDKEKMTSASAKWAQIRRRVNLPSAPFPPRAGSRRQYRSAV
jgi:hypothetical protein